MGSAATDDRPHGRTRPRTTTGRHRRRDRVGGRHGGGQPADHHGHACGGSCSTAPPAETCLRVDWRFTAGDRVKIRLVNEMDSDHPMHHPFHIHGAGRFLVLARDGVPEPNLVWKDTVLIRDRADGRHPVRRHQPRPVDGALPHRRAHASGMMFSFTVDRADDVVTAPRSSRSTSSSSAAARPAWPPPGTCAGRACASWSWRRRELGHTWRSRWDSLRLFTPAEHDALPGLAVPGAGRHLPRQGGGRRLPAGLRAAFDLPVELNARVTRLRRTDDGFQISTADRTCTARQVVVATGPFQSPSSRRRRGTGRAR